MLTLISYCTYNWQPMLCGASWVASWSNHALVRISHSSLFPFLKQHLKDEPSNHGEFSSTTFNNLLISTTQGHRIHAPKTNRQRQYAYRLAIILLHIAKWAGYRCQWYNPTSKERLHLYPVNRVSPGSIGVQLVSRGSENQLFILTFLLLMPHCTHTHHRCHKMIYSCYIMQPCIWQPD